MGITWWYQDVNRSVRENIIKEASEEAGAIVNPNKIIAVFDYNRHHNVNFPYGMVKYLYYVSTLIIISKIILKHLDAKFFSLDNLPDYHLIELQLIKLKCVLIVIII